jgi:hypothetical protein
MLKFVLFLVCRIEIKKEDVVVGTKKYLRLQFKEEKRGKRELL